MNKSDIISYLERKLKCYNLEEVKNQGFVIKIIMSPKMFNCIKEEIDFKRKGIHLEPGERGGFYKDCLVFSRKDEGEAVLIFLDMVDSFITDDIKTYV